MVRVTVPLALLSRATASWWVFPSSNVESTAWIWSPGLKFDWAAAPRSNTVLTKMGRSPWGLPSPPTMLKPRPSAPRSRTILVKVGGAVDDGRVRAVAAGTATGESICSSGAGNGAGTAGRGGGGGVVGVGTNGGSLADEAVEWFNIEGRLSSRIGGAGGCKWEGAGLLQTKEERTIRMNISLWWQLAKGQTDKRLAKKAFCCITRLTSDIIHCHSIAGCRCRDEILSIIFTSRQLSWTQKESVSQ